MKAIVAVSLALFAMTAGCAPSATPEPASTEPAAATDDAQILRQVAEVRHTGEQAYEPMVVEHPDGTLFANGFGRSANPEIAPRLWRSDDRGATWSRVDVGGKEDGAIGNSDPDLAVADDGTLYAIHLGFNHDAHRGTHIAVGASPDKGETWTWTTLSKGMEEDRPWVDVAPDGRAHAIWNDNRGGVSYARSTDGGQTWDVRQRIHPVGGSSHLAVGPHGEIAVRITPLSWGGYQFDPGTELIAVSTDGGDTWTTHKPPGRREWISDADRKGGTHLIDRWAETLSWDAAGTLYYLWSEGKSLWLARSQDQGATWQSAVILKGDNYIFYPYVDARAAGQLAALWLLGRPGSPPGDPEELRHQVARIDWPETAANPVVAMSDPFLNTYWSVPKEKPAARVVGGDYLPVVLLRDGTVGTVAPLWSQDGETRGFTWRRFDR